MTDLPEHFDPVSQDPLADRVAELRTLFPDVFREDKIDIDTLRRELGDSVEAGPERFGLTWPGKAECMRVIQEPSIGTLVPMRDESVDFDTTQNVIIEGDNLEVLKLIQKAYYGQVKLIYIDPPYNTGKEFIYPDNFREGLADYLKYSGQIDDEGLKLSANAETDGRFHSKWLSMMYPRLFLARNLLREDGVLCVSIADHEDSHLRIILNEIFGEENFLCQFVWNNEGNVDNQSAIKGVHEYIVCFARNVKEFRKPTVIDPNIDLSSKLFNDQIENTITKNGPANPPSVVYLPTGFPCTFESGEIDKRDDTWPHILDLVRADDGVLAEPCRLQSGWSSRALLDQFIHADFAPILDSDGKETRFQLTSSGAIYQYKTRSSQQGHVLSVIRNVGTSKQTSAQLARWGLDFAYPKPTFLIQYLVSVFVPPGSSDLVLDFFAGSGSTGHAVLAQNQKDGGRRQFILVQLPELTENDKYPTIASLTRARVKTAGREIAQAPARFDASELDTGFRAYSLKGSNFTVWDSEANDASEVAHQLQMAVEHITDASTEESMLTELLLKAGYPLTSPLEILNFSGVKVHSIADGALMVCLADSLTIEPFEAMAELDPAMILVLDAGFGGSDELKVNALQTVRARNQRGGSDIALRVV